MSYVVRPISDRSWIGSTPKEPTRFNSKWSATIELLEREVAALKGRNLVIEMDVSEADLKLNGELRANARPSSAAVAVAFESKHGPLFYRCDRFYTNWAHQGPEWQHNVRAIALTLEALRSVDRYGATETGQQYTGFKALPAGRAMPASHMTYDQAFETLIAIAGPDADWDDDRSLFRKARAAAHPDRRDGDRTLWDQVEQAAAVLGVSS